MGSPKNERLLIQVRRESEPSSINDYQMHGAEGVPLEFCRFFVLQLNAALHALTATNRLGGIFSVTNPILLLTPTRLLIRKGVT